MLRSKRLDLLKSGFQISARSRGKAEKEPDNGLHRRPLAVRDE